MYLFAVLHPEWLPTSNGICSELLRSPPTAAFNKVYFVPMAHSDLVYIQGDWYFHSKQLPIILVAAHET